MASRLNCVERVFGELTVRQIRRLAITSVDQFIVAIAPDTDFRNATPRPVVWTANVQLILHNAGRANAAPAERVASPVVP